MEGNNPQFPFILDGIDFNWEYPTNQQEWEGLFELIKNLRKRIGSNKILTMAYYPDVQ